MAAKPKSCYVCLSSEDNAPMYGDLLPKREDSFIVHYFCVLLANDIPQNGDDNEDVYGFLIKDIKNTIRNYSKKKCSYCYKKRAASKCSTLTCKIYFHVPCALKHSCLLQFTEPDFRVYCHIHSPQILRRIDKTTETKVLSEIKERISRKLLSQPEQDDKFNQLMSRLSERQFEEGNLCRICEEPFRAADLKTVVTPPCCWSRNGLKPDYRTYGLHLNCLRVQAYYSGYKTRCPFCNRADYFLKWANKIGVFVPQRHALWEHSEIENYSLIGVLANCNAETCVCPDGREYSAEETEDEFHLIVCCTCGSQAVHRKCLAQSSICPTNEYNCDVCHISIIQPAVSMNIEDNTERTVELLDSASEMHDNNLININKVPTIDVHNTDSEPEYTADELFDEMDQVKPIIKLPKPIPLKNSGPGQLLPDHVREHIRRMVQEHLRQTAQEQIENGNIS